MGSLSIKCKPYGEYKLLMEPYSVAWFAVLGLSVRIAQEYDNMVLEVFGESEEDKDPRAKIVVPLADYDQPVCTYHGVAPQKNGECHICLAQEEKKAAKDMVYNCTTCFAPLGSTMGCQRCIAVRAINQIGLKPFHSGGDGTKPKVFGMDLAEVENKTLAQYAPSLQPPPKTMEVLLGAPSIGQHLQNVEKTLFAKIAKDHLDYPITEAGKAVKVTPAPLHESKADKLSEKKCPDCGGHLEYVTDEGLVNHCGSCGLTWGCQHCSAYDCLGDCG